MKRFLKKLHLWLSIPVGIFITVICLTGAILVFEEEITLLAHRRACFCPATTDKPLPMAELMPRVNGQLPDTVGVAGVQIFRNPRRTYIGTLSGKGQRTIFIDPYTARIVDREGVRPSAFFEWIRELHRSLTFSGAYRNYGRLVVGVISLFFAIILISGIAIWLPRKLKGLKMRLTVRVRSGWRWFWYDLHVAGGIYAALFLLLMALTGLTWSFRWYHDGVYRMLGAKTAVVGREAPVPDPDNPGDLPSIAAQPSGRNDRQATMQAAPEPGAAKSGKVDYRAWDAVLDSLGRSGKGYRSLTIRNRSAILSSDKAIRSSRATNRYVFDAQTGEIKSAVLFSGQSKENRLNAWIFSIHTGEWGGMVTKCLAFVAAIIGASLPITGYYLYLRRLMRKHK